jgi:hypothetical protein
LEEVRKSWDKKVVGDSYVGRWYGYFRAARTTIEDYPNVTQLKMQALLDRDEGKLF